MLTPPALPTHTNTSSWPFQVWLWPALSTPSKLLCPSTCTWTQASWLILAVTSAPDGTGVAVSGAAAGTVDDEATVVGVIGMGVGVGTEASASIAGWACRNDCTWR